MRRKMVMATALIVLVAAAAAYAASINTYTTTLVFTSKHAGSKAKPSPVGFVLRIDASGTDGNRTAVLLDIKTRIYGVTADGKDFPTCSLKKIATAQTDTVCPKGAEVASGYITSVLGFANNFAAMGAACDPITDVWNSGRGKLTFFFVDTPTHQCIGGALHTGSVGPYPATDKQSGKYLVIDVPVPHYVSFPVGGEAGSLETEYLKFFKSSKKVHGKTVAPFASVACQSGKRPYAVAFKATLPTTGAHALNTVSHTAPCS